MNIKRGKGELVALVAEDSGAIRELVCEMLRLQGVTRVIEAADGEQALSCIRDHGRDIDLMFCDLNMPGIDGIDVLRSVALAYPHIAVVVFSGLESRLLRSVADMAEGMGLTVLGVLGKPFSEEEVGSLIRRFREAGHDRGRLQSATLTPDEIDRALDEDRIEVYYQPKTRMADGVAVGVEALVRLSDRHLGVLGPASFLAVAEISGRMPALTRRVLSKALRQAGAWRREGLDLHVSINLTPGSLRRMDLPDEIAHMAHSSGVSPERITLELTESYSDLTPEMLHTASRCRLKGFHLSVDDFGTGDSGLYRLRSLPFTELKIDRGFVQHAQHRDDLRSVLETSIDLGHRLNLTVVAEGVENWTQWHLLKNIHCDQAQGFLAAPAMPAERIPDTLARWRVRLASEGVAAMAA